MQHVWNSEPTSSKRLEIIKLGAWKFQRARRQLKISMWQETSVTLRTHRYQLPPYKIELPWQPGTWDLCTPALGTWRYIIFHILCVQYRVCFCLTDSVRSSDLLLKKYKFQTFACSGIRTISWYRNSYIFFFQWALELTIKISKL